MPVDRNFFGKIKCMLRLDVMVTMTAKLVPARVAALMACACNLASHLAI